MSSVMVHGSWFCAAASMGIIQSRRKEVDEDQGDYYDNFILLFSYSQAT
jgi:hypothetical protein